jgi:hypothetical protein
MEVLLRSVARLTTTPESPRLDPPACLLACLPACLPAYLPACRPICLLIIIIIIILQ